MKSRLPMLLFALLSCVVPAAMAQGLAFVQTTAKQPDISKPAEKPLKDLIQSLKEHYKTDIIFLDQLVEGRTAPAQAVEWSASLENNLNRILKPFGLEPKKTRNGGYIITKKKFVKEISYQVQRLTQPNASVSIARQQSYVLKQDPLASVQVRQMMVRGRVADAEKNESLPGVSVVIKGSQQGTITDTEGNYALEVPLGTETLVFSFVGYIAQEIEINKRTQLDVSLKVDQKSLEEVLVVGYGTQERATITGSIVSVKGSEIVKTPAVNVSNALVGRLPGVTAVQRSGEPGRDGSEIRIRGTNSLGNNNPLVIVDGIPGRSLDRIDPNTIESLTVLKDASAAIYGSQAANGVILITTKRGKVGKPEISFNYSDGFNQPTRLPKMASSSEYATMLNEIDVYNNRQQRYSADEIQKFRDGSDPWGHPNTDWFKAVLKPRSRQNNLNATVTGGTEKIRYFMNLGSKFQDGYYYKSSTKYRQFDFRSNIDGTISDHISVRFDVSGRIENRNLPTQGSGNIFSGLMRSDPGKHAYWPDGTPGPDVEQGNNPAVTSTDATGYDRDKQYVFNSNLRVDVKIPFVTGLAFSGNASFDKTFRFRKNWQTPWYLYSWDGSTYDANGKPLLVRGKKGFDDPRLQQWAEDNQNVLLNGILTYGKNIGKHAIKVMAGIESREGQGNSFSAFRRYFVSTSLDQLFAGGDINKDNTGSAYENARLNYFGRVNYNLSEKLLLEFVWRYDGSYIFPKSGRYGFFPGISAGYRLSEEPFWKNNVSWANDLKVRASWGQTGNDRIDEWQYLSSYGYNSTTYVLGVTQENKLLRETRIPNENVTWEVANQANIGFEAGMFKNKLYVEFDYFNNKRSQILWQRNASVPSSTGLTLPRENIGKVSNSGFEFNVGYRSQIQKFKYNVSFNGSYSRNKITFWDESPGRPEWQQSTGKPIPSNPAFPDNDLYYQAIGIFKNQAGVDAYPHWTGARPGDVIFKDVNDDGVINGNDRVRHDKTNIPRFTAGTNLDLSYGPFDLTILIQGATGAIRYIDTYSGDSGNFLQDFYNNRWTEANPDSKEPRAFNRSQEYWRTQGNTQFIRNTDYVRLKTVQLAYNVPSRLLNKVRMSSLRFFVSGYNLLTYSPDLRDFDPESDNSTGSSYPVQRVLNGGVSFTF
ncbi:SusC/RagA family TonB-linked outer membrane protein [Dyadobacter sp. CY261]|uniref:SusC/RagA family TonB-linked outer membrane protein n=1 Tax=Dyadobacter sp. CY261 TaxID=2907203 RepID=UPI001F3C25C0|nr:SusC/RagA family TonB-linked outer membrane protein [Dyadobacter sp. CY261]MCF0069735.1 SusC/RagA family TonB-linked outer membrane protein [Dyadobacter sp. CY261]